MSNKVEEFESFDSLVDAQDMFQHINTKCIYICKD
jgi:hypothetical protein